MPTPAFCQGGLCPGAVEMDGGGRAEAVQMRHCCVSLMAKSSRTGFS